MARPQSLDGGDSLFQPEYPGSQRCLRMIANVEKRWRSIRCKYTGPGLVQAERARVRYGAYNQNLLELEMLSLPFERWDLEESSGEQTCWGWVAIGVVCWFFAYRQQVKTRQELASSPLPQPPE